MSKQYVMVHDEIKCIGCQSCTVACRSANNIPEGMTRLNIPVTGPFGTYPNLKNHYVRNSCRQCAEPACVKICPTGAAQIKDDIVIVDTKTCIGCMKCRIACPYKVPYKNKVTRKADHCNLCADTRLAQGLQPACVSVCPTDALVFGDANDAQSSVAKLLASKTTYRDKVESLAEPKLYHITNHK